MLNRCWRIGSIPTILWGPPSNNVYIFVHGKKSRKEEAEGFARIAAERGYQVVSFDLPEHGERKAEGYPCIVQNAMHDLDEVGVFATGHWKNVSLIGFSLGAYFSLVAYPDLQFSKCLFLSPILDMQGLIQGMMKRAGVTEAALRERQEIVTPAGETLSWPYYAFVKENPIVKWNSPTYILFGANDELTSRSAVEIFAGRFHCNLEVVQHGDHYFHTKEQVDILDRWLESNL